VLLSMLAMSNSFKKVTDHKSAIAQGREVQRIANQLTFYATELKKYPLPSNKVRIKIKATRSKKIEAISMEMAGTIAIISNNAPVMSVFAAEMNKAAAQLEASQKTFNAYFEPDIAPASPKKKP